MGKKLTQDDFVCAAILQHNAVYDYSLASYKSNKDKVQIICKQHGVFWQVAGKHLRGQGCKKCGQARSNKHNTKTYDQFLADALSKHGNTYSYNPSSYAGNTSLVTITCNIHGDFKQVANKHIKGQCCPSCNNERRSLNMRGDYDKFVTDANSIHNNRYDYNKVTFVNDKTPVTIVCDKHGEFNQTPSAHKKGSGCPECAVSGYKSDQAGFIYVLTSNDLFKVGITNRVGNTRVHEISTGSKRKFKVALKVRFTDGKIPQSVEQDVLKYLRANYKRTEDKFNGSSECFVNVDYNATMTVVNETLLKHMPQEIRTTQ